MVGEVTAWASRIVMKPAISTTQDFAIRCMCHSNKVLGGRGCYATPAWVRNLAGRVRMPQNVDKGCRQRSLRQVCKEYYGAPQPRELAEQKPRACQGPACYWLWIVRGDSPGISPRGELDASSQ